MGGPEEAELHPEGSRASHGPQQRRKGPWKHKRQIGAPLGRRCSPLWRGAELGGFRGVGTGCLSGWLSPSLSLPGFH